MGLTAPSQTLVKGYPFKFHLRIVTGEPGVPQCCCVLLSSPLQQGDRQWASCVPYGGLESGRLHRLLWGEKGGGGGDLLEKTWIERESWGGLEDRVRGAWEEGMGGGDGREARGRSLWEQPLTRAGGWQKGQSTTPFAIQITGVRSGNQWCCINLLTANVSRILILDPVFLARPTLGPLFCQGHPSLCSPTRYPKTYTSPQARHPFTPAQTAVIQQRVRQVSHCAIKELGLGDKAEIPAVAWRAKWR